MSSIAYGEFKKALFKAQIADLSSAGVTVKCMLVGATYSALSDATKHGHAFKSDITDEIVGTGYTAGGQALTSKTVVLNGSFEGIVDADDPTWPTSTITAYGAVFYIDTGVAGTSRVIRFVDFGGAKSSSAGTFTVQLAADGYLKNL